MDCKEPLADTSRKTADLHKLNEKNLRFLVNMCFDLMENGKSQMT